MKGRRHRQRRGGACNRGVGPGRNRRVGPGTKRPGKRGIPSPATAGYGADGTGAHRLVPATHYQRVRTCPCRSARAVYAPLVLQQADGGLCDHHPGTARQAFANTRHVEQIAARDIHGDILGIWSYGCIFQRAVAARRRRSRGACSGRSSRTGSIWGGPARHPPGPSVSSTGARRGARWLFIRRRSATSTCRPEDSGPESWLRAAATCSIPSG